MKPFNYKRTYFRGFKDSMGKKMLARLSAIFLFISFILGEFWEVFAVWTLLMRL